MLNIFEEIKLLKKAIGRTIFDKVRMFCDVLLLSLWKTVNPFALRMTKTLWSFGHSECTRVKTIFITFGQPKRCSLIMLPSTENEENYN